MTIHFITINFDKHNEKYVAVHSQWVAKGIWCNEGKGGVELWKKVAYATPLL